MSISMERDGDRVRIAVGDRLVVGNRAELKHAIAQSVASGGRRFVIDFRSTFHVDSSGLGSLLAASRHIRQNGGELRLVNLNEDLRTLFRLTRLDSLFAIGDEGEVDAP